MYTRGMQWHGQACEFVGGAKVRINDDGTEFITINI
jgi:hypothetical protein